MRFVPFDRSFSSFFSSCCVFRATLELVTHPLVSVFDGGPKPTVRGHWSWDTLRAEVLEKSRKKGPSCLGRKVVGTTL